jgi:hypothetical protein
MNDVVYVGEVCRRHDGAGYALYRAVLADV